MLLGREVPQDMALAGKCYRGTADAGKDYECYGLPMVNGRNGAVAFVLVVFAALMRVASAPAAAAGPACASPLPGAPMLVTASCVDPRYNDPYIDVDEQRTTPVPHRYIHEDDRARVVDGYRCAAVAGRLVPHEGTRGAG